MVVAAVPKGLDDNRATDAAVASTLPSRGDALPETEVLKLQRQVEALRQELASVCEAQVAMEARLKNDLQGYVRFAVSAAVSEMELGNHGRAKNLRLPGARSWFDELGMAGALSMGCSRLVDLDKPDPPEPGGGLVLSAGSSLLLADWSEEPQANGEQFRQLSLFGKCSSENITEYRRLERQAKEGEEVTTYDLKMNMWSCGIFTLVEDVPYLLRGHNSFESFIRLSTIISVLVVNVGLQCGFLFFIAQDLLQPAMHLAQEMYARYHALAFDDHGHFQQDDFHDLGAMKADLCQIPLSKVWFLSAVLFLWITTCLRSFLELLEDIYVFQRLPTLPKGIAMTQMFVEGGDDAGYDLLVCISTWTRLCLWVLIFIPQIIIIFLVFFLGSAWLMGTLNFGDLILNSLALEFVTGIDELLFECFMPQRLKDNLSLMKVVYPTFQKPPLRRMGTDLSEMVTTEERESKMKDMADLKRAYGASMITLAAVAMTLLMVLHTQQVIPNYRWDVHPHCESVVQQGEESLCRPFESDCFPYGFFSPSALAQHVDRGMKLIGKHGHRAAHGKL